MVLELEGLDVFDDGAADTIGNSSRMSAPISRASETYARARAQLSTGGDFLTCIVGVLEGLERGTRLHSRA